MNWNVQVATWTSNNRYPGVFRTVQARIAQKRGASLGQAKLKILSFGCSTGSELSTLRSYFPEASLYGCDVNPTALQAASEALLMDETVIFESSPDNIQARGPFDIIFAMSVLCRFPDSLEPGLLDLRQKYDVKDYERIVDVLSNNLKRDGILCLYNTNYSFAQLDVASKFRVVRSPLIASNGFVDKFDLTGQRVTWCEQIGPYYVHRMRRNPTFDENFDFTGCIFEKAKEDKSDIFIPVGEGGSTDRIEPPSLFRFGPDLGRCARDGIIATALGYWFDGGGEDQRVVRAWYRATPAGTIEPGKSWAVSGDLDSKAALSAQPKSWAPNTRETRSPRARRVIGSIKNLIRAGLRTQ